MEKISSTDMNVRAFGLEGLRLKFRYSIKELISYETYEEVVKQKSHTVVILMIGFALYSAVTIFSCISRHYYHGVVTNISLTVLFVLIILHLKVYKSHVLTTIVGTFGICLILFFHFIMEVDMTIGMDAFWLFILITPFVTDYVAGVIYGSAAALWGLILSFVCFRTPVREYL